MGDKSNIFIDNCKFTQNFAMQYAVFKIQGETIMKISNSQFSQNIALERNSIGQLIQVGEGCSIVNSVFSENIAQSLDGKSG